MLYLDANQRWTLELIDIIMDKLEEINNEKYQFDVFTNQVEIITYEGMLNAYANSGGLPILYPHWSFGETFVRNYENYKGGRMGLALEIILNTDPALVYCMEDNSAIAQAMVMAHAGFGHNSLYKCNYMFKQWTDAESIVDYLVYARNFVVDCEKKYGIKEVERMLDAAHSLQFNGLDKYKRPIKLSSEAEEKRREEREKYRQSQVNELWRTLLRDSKKKVREDQEDSFPKEPQENILKFLEEHAPLLKDWQREILRIVRRVAQYFYPQFQCRLIHEGFATYTHYKFMHDLYDRGHISDGGMLEFYGLHASVVHQYSYHYGPHDINVYALGFAMFKDIERVSMNPTEEDREWFGNQEWVGNGDWLKNVKWIRDNFKDESFVMQFLSPKIIRDFRMFAVTDDDAVSTEYITVTGIHDDNGYKKVRNKLAARFNINSIFPDIQIVDVDILNDRTMSLEHVVYNGRPLHESGAQKTLQYLAYLWGYPVILRSVDQNNDEVLQEWEANTGSNSELDDFNLSDL